MEYEEYLREINYIKSQAMEHGFSEEQAEFVVIKLPALVKFMESQ